MPIPLHDIVSIYERIKEEININYVSVVLYTAIDIDSLCSLKMLTVIISHKLRNSSKAKASSIKFTQSPLTQNWRVKLKIPKAIKQ